MLRRRFLTVMAGASAAIAAPSVLRAQSATIKLATSTAPPSIHNIYLHVAYERGFFRQNGITVSEFMQLRGGPLANQAIAAGQIDVTASDAEGLLSATSNGYAIRGVTAPGAHLSYIVSVRKEISSFADLKGKPFAVSRPGALSQYLMFPMLDGARVPRDSVQWLSVGGGRERMLALLSDRVKGALLHIDFAMEAVNDPNINSLKSVADILPDYPFELLFMRKDMLDKNPAAATAIVRAIIQACRYIVTDKSGTFEVMLKYVPGMSTEVLDRAYAELIRIRGFGVNGDMTEKNLAVAHDLAFQNRQIDRALPLDQWADFGPQRRAMESLGPFTG
jgi:ABC-type nitrate/sulfonate/bicarbonate transport system substrate-binding protein